MNPEIALRDETPLLVNRKYGFEGDETLFIREIFSSGIRQICIQNPHGQFGPNANPLGHNAWSCEANVRRDTLWLHTISLSDRLMRDEWGRISSDIFNCDGEKESGHVKKGIIIRNYDCPNDRIQDRLKYILEGDKQTQDDFYPKFMDSLEHVELQICPSNSTTPDDVREAIEIALTVYGDRIKNLGLYAIATPADSLGKLIETARLLSGNQNALHVSDDAHYGEEFLRRSLIAVDHGATSLSYGIKKPGQLAGDPALPRDFLQSIRNTSIGVDVDAYENAYRLLPKMNYYFREKQ